MSTAAGVSGDPAAAANITQLGESLRNAMQTFYGRSTASPDYGFGTKPVIILAHSMGGLVARSMMQEYTFADGKRGGEKVARLITLGTPHHGSPLADAALDPANASVAAQYTNAHPGFLKDLEWDNYDGLYPSATGHCNAWLANLNNYSPASGGTYGPCPAPATNAVTGYYDKIISYASSNIMTSSGNTFVANSVLLTSYNWMHGSGLAKAYNNDGAVPSPSALFSGAQIASSHSTACDHGALVFNSTATGILSGFCPTNGGPCNSNTTVYPSACTVTGAPTLSSNNLLTGNQYPCYPQPYGPPCSTDFPNTAYDGDVFSGVAADIQVAATNPTGAPVQTIAFGSAPSISISGTGIVSATATSGLPVALTSLTPSICTISGTTVTGIAAGICTVAANQPGNYSYNPAAQVTQSFTITLANQTITFGPAPSIVFGGTGAVTATDTSGLPVTFTSTTSSICSVNGSTVSGVAAGLCTIAANQAGNTTYNPATQVTQSFTIAQAAQTLSFGGMPAIVVGGTATASAVASSGLPVSFSSTTPGVCTVSGSTASGIATGTCTISANQAGNANYSAAPQVTQSFSVLSGILGGTLRGLTAGITISITNNGANTLTLTADGTFTVPGVQSVGSAYNFTIVPNLLHTQPTLPCTITYGAAMYSAQISPLNVFCGPLPVSNAWSSAGSMASPRIFHTTTLLPTGKVLVTGGTTPAGIASNSAELYDPATNTWSAAGSMATGRGHHTATLLPSNKVLITGGGNVNTGIGDAELYDAAANTWSAAGNMVVAARGNHTATLLPNGKVLVAGGTGTVSAELYDPATNTWSAAANMITARTGHTATLLPNGKVLVAGGTLTGTAELYDAATNTWSAAGNMTTARDGFSVTLLPTGKVLAAGGASGGMTINSAELYDPSTNAWLATTSMVAGRSGQTATLLSNGKLLVVGGSTNPGGGPMVGTGTAEIYW